MFILASSLPVVCKGGCEVIPSPNRASPGEGMNKQPPFLNAHWRNCPWPLGVRLIGPVRRAGEGLEGVCGVLRALILAGVLCTPVVIGQMGWHGGPKTEELRTSAVGSSCSCGICCEWELGRSRISGAGHLTHLRVVSLCRMVLVSHGASLCYKGSVYFHLCKKIALFIHNTR